MTVPREDESGRSTTALAETRVHAVRWGLRGPRVLLVHAIGFDHRTWDSVVPHLDDRFQLAALDLPGHGRSEGFSTGDYGLWSLGRRVLQFMDELGWEDAIVVGNSLGGGTSLALTLLAPERVRGLALVNSIAYRKGLPHLGRLAFLPLVPLVGGLAPSLAVRIGLESVRSGWGSVTASRCEACCTYLRSPQGREAFFQTLRQLYGGDLDEMAERYHEIQRPTLILHGTWDPLIRIGHAEKLARTIPSARLVRLPRLGHFPQEEAPEKVALELRKFFDSLGPDTPQESGGADPTSLVHAR